MAPLSRSQINGIKDFSLRTIMLSVYDQLDMHNQVTGTNFLEPTNSPQSPASAPPPNAALSVSGANGVFTIAVTNPKQSLNKAIYHEISYSNKSNFTSGVTTLPVSTSTHLTEQIEGVSLWWRIRSSYDQSNWNAYQAQTSPVSSGLRSSAGTANGVVLNQTNYANVDSVAAGAAANVRIYGKAGPTTQYPSVKGAAETIDPSAIVINVPYSSQQIVAWDGENYQVRATLPEVFADGLKPVGAVSVVGSGAVVEPTLALVLGAGGAVIAWNVVTQGNGLTGPVTLTIFTGTGTGATPGAQTISGGKLISVAPGNPGSGYLAGDTVTATGGTFGGAVGGGQNIGGNGGRLIINDGTLGPGRQ